MMSCENIIQLFLLPNLFRIGIENLSIAGAHKNFREYVKTIQEKNPIILKFIPTSLNHAERVEKIRMYGRPDANPNELITSIFLKSNIFYISVPIKLFAGI